MKTDWVTKLETWYNHNKRDMPWRNKGTAYAVWISEMMLQQTQVATVIPYFNRFITKFPTVKDLAKADIQDVLKSWEGLGYYSRARNLHKTAKIIAENNHQSFPNSFKELQTLPGIGPYSAAAIASIVFENPIPVVDGNVLRVFCRFFEIEDDIRQTSVKDTLFKKLKPFIKESTPSIFNQAIMECGALICKPKQPECTSCPLNNDCKAYKHKKTNQLPFKSKSKPIPHYHIAIGLIWKNKKVLIAKRKENQMLGGLWEFPGGKQKNNEPLEQTVIRELKEECNITVTPTTFIGTIKHTYSHFKISLHAYNGTLVKGIPKPLCSDEIKWIRWEDIKKHPFPTANQKIFKLIATLNQRKHQKKFEQTEIVQ